MLVMPLLFQEAVCWPISLFRRVPDSDLPPESTTIALLAKISGLLEPLRDFVQRKPVWGTCAGAILLSNSAEGTKKGGQELLGGTSIKIARNGWGSQVGTASRYRLPLRQTLTMVNGEWCCWSL